MKSISCGREGTKPLIFSFQTRVVINAFHLLLDVNILGKAMPRNCIQRVMKGILLRWLGPYLISVLFLTDRLKIMRMGYWVSQNRKR